MPDRTWVTIKRVAFIIHQFRTMQNCNGINKDFILIIRRILKLHKEVTSNTYSDGEGF